MPDQRQSLSLLLSTLSPSDFFLADGGIETAAIFNAGIDLPEFALGAALAKEDNDDGKVRAFYDEWVESMAVNARSSGAKGFVLDTPTFRSSLTWAEKLGLSKEDFEVRNNKILNPKGRLALFVLECA